MAVLVLSTLDYAPIVVDGSVRERVYSISGTIADADTATITEFNTVTYAILVPATAAGCGIAFSGSGNTTLTFKMTASATAGRLIVRGY